MWDVGVLMTMDIALLLKFANSNQFTHYYDPASAEDTSSIRFSRNLHFLTVRHELSTAAMHPWKRRVRASSLRVQPNTVPASTR
jgi:hypothetical protein